MSLIRHCRECGKEITLQSQDEGKIIACNVCGHSMKYLAGRLCNTVTAEEKANPEFKFSIFANRN